MKQIIFIATAIFLVLVIVNLSFSLYSLWSKQDLLMQTKQQLAREQQEHISLENGLKQVGSPLYVEEQARDHLFMGKPGDVTVVLPSASSSAQAKAIEAAKPIWLQWWDLFF